MRLSIGHQLTGDGRRAVNILDGLLQTIGLPNHEPLRAYAALKRAGMSAGQLFGDNPALERAISDWLTGGGAQDWIAQERRRMHNKANGKPPASPLTEVAPARRAGKAAAQTVVLVEPVDAPFSPGGN